ncbi:carboxypeptidase regulatory-like domain-containing protein [Haloplanus rallus]|uniref:Carboxypeptidase regulatory-like domain-containing protein n=1 Tax=Haloplanus rallus TaxID=1816183 RepID=A0A6B9FF52_9EURY|nr:carboxypeptidase-like regulatory domain-containing protein [Haloplanus rallus]QGX94253.1 carboxypeptidase regulatory-like domain-containing protein [Haloplanus rallus]
MKRILTLLVVLGCLAAVPTATATTSVSGTVTVDGDTADGAQVTVVPVTESLQRAGDPARTTVSGSSFSVDVADAPQYAVRVSYEGTTHYEVLRNTTRATIHLSGSVDGRVVDDDGSPLSGVAVQVTDDSGFVVTRVETGDDGEFSVGPVEENETYRLRATVDGVPYRRTASAAENGTTIVARPPITDAARLSVANDSRNPHVLQVVPPGNESSAPSVIETVTLRNPTDRPFVGLVELHMPTNATPYAGMVAGEEAEYRRTDAGVELNVSVPANGVTRVGVAYDLTGPVVETAPRRATGSLTVVVQGYDPNAIDHSENLRVGDAPIPMLVSDGPVDAGERIRLDLDGARTRGSATGADAGTGNAGAGESAAVAADDGAAENNTIPPFPGLPILGAVGGMVVVGLVGYRLFPGDGDG